MGGSFLGGSKYFVTGPAISWLGGKLGKLSCFRGGGGGGGGGASPAPPLDWSPDGLFFIVDGSHFIEGR